MAPAGAGDKSADRPRAHRRNFQLRKGLPLVFSWAGCISLKAHSTEGGACGVWTVSSRRVSIYNDGEEDAALLLLALIFCARCLSLSSASAAIHVHVAVISPLPSALSSGEIRASRAAPPYRFEWARFCSPVLRVRRRSEYVNYLLSTCIIVIVKKKKDVCIFVSHNLVVI